MVKTNTVNFAGLNFLVWQHNNIFAGLLNLCLADAHLSFLYCTKLTPYNETFTSYWAAQKQSRPHTFGSITHLHQHTWSIHNSYHVQIVHTKSCKYFRLQLVIPKVRLIRRFVIPKVRYSEGSLFRRFVIPKVRYSEGSLIRR